MALRPIEQPADIVIWGSTSALGVVTGVGAAYLLWNDLHASANPGILSLAVVAFCVGLGLVGMALRQSPTRVFLLVASISMALAFFLGSGAFSSLTS